MDVVIDDGGRAEAGFRGNTGDCVVRAIAIATRLPYRFVYDNLHALAKEKPRKGQKNASPRNGVHRKHYEPFLKELGWQWVPTMKIGSGCVVHLREDELPGGRVICMLSKHACAVIDGVIYDTHDPSRGGRRCVYGYFVPGPLATGS